MTSKFARIACVAAAIMVTAGAAGCEPKKDKQGPPDGWVEVPCDPWPGGEGPCYRLPSPDPNATGSYCWRHPDGEEGCSTYGPKERKTP